MKWICWPAAVGAALLGTPTHAADFARYGRNFNDGQVYSAPMMNHAGGGMNAPVQGMPMQAAPMQAAPMAGPIAGQATFDPMYAAPAPVAASGSCGCGQSAGSNGGYMGFSWAAGCGQSCGCCSGIWDSYAAQKRSWCDRCNHCLGSNFGSSFGCGSGGPSRIGGCGASFGCGSGAGGWPGCGMGFVSGSGCQGMPSFGGGCGGGCGSGGFYPRMRGYANSCDAGNGIGGSSNCGDCGSAANAPAVHPQATPATPTPAYSADASPELDEAESPVSTQAPERVSPNRNVPPTATPSREIKTPVEPKGKTANRPTAPRSWVNWSSFKAGF